MMTAIISLFLASSPPSSSRLESQPRDECEDTRRLELSRPTAGPQRICVSPGTMTGLLFDSPVVVEIQDEIRFVEVTRGRNGVSFVPPQDMLPGEQLRLTATLQVGAIRESVTFALVAHPEQATHQVEVYRDQRSWQSLRDELNQASLTSKRLQEEKEALEAELEQIKTRLALSMGLRGDYISGELDRHGIETRALPLLLDEAPVGVLNAPQATSYRGKRNVAVEVLIRNDTREIWTLKKATLVNNQGETLEAIRIWQPNELLPDQDVRVFVEFDATSITSDRVTLNLGGAGNRVLSIPNVVFP